jgi:hypothetical protein
MCWYIREVGDVKSSVSCGVLHSRAPVLLRYLFIFIVWQCSEQNMYLQHKLACCVWRNWIKVAIVASKLNLERCSYFGQDADAKEICASRSLKTRIQANFRFCQCTVHYTVISYSAKLAEFHAKIVECAQFKFGHRFWLNFVRFGRNSSHFWQIALSISMIFIQFVSKNWPI